MLLKHCLFIASLPFHRLIAFSLPRHHGANDATVTFILCINDAKLQYIGPVYKKSFGGALATGEEWFQWTMVDDLFMLGQKGDTSWMMDDDVFTVL